MSNKATKNMQKLWTVALWIFPVLFLIDDILGFNGYQFTIAGKSIRIILFCITAAELCVYSLFVCCKDHISLLPGREDKVWLFHLLKPIDYLVMLFVVGNALWATVIPLLVRGNMQYSLKDFSTILVMVLYFPVMFLIRAGRLKLELLEKIVYVLCVVLAAWHCIMYVGETVSPGFYESYYDFIDIISFGTAVRSDVVIGFGITRVVQTTSLFLLIGAFAAVRYCLKGKFVHLIPLLLFVFAICVTYTKSIWFGFGLGLIVYLLSTGVSLCNGKMWKRCLIVAVATVVMVTSLNYVVFDNTIFSRAMNTFRTQEDTERLQEELDAMVQAGISNTTPSTEAVETVPSTEVVETVPSTEVVETVPPTEPVVTTPPITQEDIDQKQNEIWDAKGTQQANALRAQQNAALLNKWKQSKWIGFGYGSYAEECIRNETFPFMYESALPSLMMKTGLVGCLLWVIFIAGATVTACVFFWKRERSDLFWWLGLAISFALAVQTNPFLFTFAGFSVLLYLMITMQEDTTMRRG